MKTPKTPADALKFIRAVANKQGWVVTPDSDFLETIANGLTSNYNRFGYFLCPCRDGDGDRQADRDIICPCDYLEPDHEEYGHCFCGLFLSKAFAESGKGIRPIPERRPSAYL